MILFRQRKKLLLFRWMIAFPAAGLFLPLLNGCGTTLFSGGEDPVRAESYSELYAERITLAREKEIFAKRSLIFCTTGDFPADLVKQLQEALAKEQIRLQELPPASGSLLTAFLRSGKVDLIAGKFTPQQIRFRYLMPVEIRAGGESKRDPDYCFAIRSSSHRLKELLEKIPFRLKEKSKKESGDGVRSKRSRSENFRKKH